MIFDVFTLFPGVIQPYLDSSILQRACENGLIHVDLHNIRDWTSDKHHVTDDTPYGGGGGMVMKAPPIFDAVESVLGAPPTCPLIYLSPLGRTFTTAIARELATLPRIGLLCGRYEGVDERVIENLVTDQISIGDYVVTGGELPALILIDAITRFIPGALGDPQGALNDSFTDGLLEYPHYTRPEEFRGWRVPPELLSGNHAQIARWRKKQALRRTMKHRPDMLSIKDLSKEDMKVIKKIQENGEGDEKI
jgi:tRNA (guanine37-N1)-methyltransferase